MIIEPSKQWIQTFKKGIDTLPDTPVHFLIKTGRKDSSIMMYLTEKEDTYENMSEGKNFVHSVTRPLNSVQLFSLMSFIQPLNKKIEVIIEENSFTFNSFRGVLYAYAANPNILWNDDIGVSFKSESVECAKRTFDFLQSNRIDK